MVSKAQLERLERLGDNLEILVLTLGMQRLGMSGNQAMVTAPFLQEGLERIPRPFSPTGAEDISQFILDSSRARNMLGLPAPSRRSRPAPRKKVSKYHRKYGREFKKLAPSYKKKSGGWKKNGFKRCAAAARRKCR